MKLAFIGAGRVVTWQLKELQNHSKINISGAYDIDPSVQDSLGEYGCYLYPSLEALLENSPDIIAISTPSKSHFDVLKYLADKVKSGTIITIEKPTFLCQNQFEEAISLSKKNNLRIFPIFHR